MQMPKYQFDCGCEFDVLDETVKPCDGLPSLDIDYYNIPRDCPATWDIYKSGRTKGVFQLENHLGQHWAKELQTNSIEDAAALISLFRPGCISGDTEILNKIYKYPRGMQRHSHTIEDMYNNKDKYKKIVSYNEKTGLFFENDIEDIHYTGEKEVFEVKVSPYNDIYRPDMVFYSLKCTDDHKILTPDGYVELKDLKENDRIALTKYSRRKYEPRSGNFVKGEKYFQELCFQNYKYKCLFCDWKKGKLDTNHIEGNRKTNNSPENLCFLCPNDHRLYTEGKISAKELIEARKKYILPKSEDITWGRYIGKNSLGVQKVYDITMKGPHHNFVAGNVIVHNCLRSKIDGVSMTQLYADRKKGESNVENVIEALRPILAPTFFVLTFQEQSMRIAMDIAGYNEEEADVLRKAIGKKDAKLMASLKESFIKGCSKMGLVTSGEAEEIFGWIRESQRYSFNKSHGVGYGDLGYWTAYAKAHFPLHFFSAWISFAPEKQKPKLEVRDLLFDCQLFDIPVYPPSILELYGGNTSINNGEIHLGLRHVSNVGYSSIKKLIKGIQKSEDKIGKPLSEFTWYEFLIFCSNESSTTAINNLISVGGLDHMGLSRKEMLHEYNIWGPKSGNKPRLSDKEKNFLRENIKNYPNLLAGMEHLCYTNKNTPVSVKGRIKFIEDMTNQLRNPPFSMSDDMKWIASKELNLIGKSISIHNTEASRMATNTTCREFLDGKNMREMTLIGEIGRFKEYPGKGNNKGRKMCAMSLEDKTGRINAMCFFDNYDEYGSEFFEGNIITVMIRRSNDGKAIIEKVY